jgi:uncharacterized membrane protein
MKLGPVTLKSRVKITAWEQDRKIALDSIKGFVNNSVWRFEPTADDRTEIIVDFYYELPGGIAGKALGRAIEPFVSVAIRHTEQTLRRNIEQHYQAQRGR